MKDHTLFKTEVQRCSKISKIYVVCHFFSKALGTVVVLYNHIISHILYHYEYIITKTQRTSYVRYNSRCTWRLDQQMHQCYHCKVLTRTKWHRKHQNPGNMPFGRPICATQREDIESYWLNLFAFLLIPGVLWKDLTQLYQGNRLQQTTGFEYRFTMIYEYSMFCWKFIPLLNNLYG